jgi:LCP family protein required for cell wall assembly
MPGIFERLRNANSRSPVTAAPAAPGLSAKRIAAWGIVVAIAVGLFIAVRNLTACWQVTALPGIRPSSCAGGGDQLPGLVLSNTPGATPIATATQEVEVPGLQYPQWDGGSRINIVFFGLRGGEASGEGCPLCTDTIIVLTVDPASKTAGMISVPRDMFVNIPGFGFSRINTAWTSGVAARLPGGGPGLAMKAVSQFLGVPIQYYIQVDFGTFVSFINLIDGIDIYSHHNYLLSKLGGGQDKIRITCCGLRHLTGPAALAYARCRDISQGCSDGDVGRSQRQQQVIMAVREKVFSPQYFPKLMAQAPQLYTLFSSGVHTNLSLQDALKLAVLVKDIPVDRIQQGLIDDHMTLMGNVTLAGQKASILMPIPDKIRVLRDQIFTAGGAVGPTAQGTSQSLMLADGARVRVVNDSTIPNLDIRTGNFLLAQGMHVTERGAPTGVSNQTVVIIYAPKLYALRYLINPLGMIGTSNQVVFRPDPAQTVDLEIRLGNDWASKLPPGY